MKFFEKTFLIILTLFVVIFHIGMFIVVHFTYQEELIQAKQKARGESYFIVSSISNDFHSLESISSLTYEQKENIFSSYQRYYETQGILLGLWEEATFLFGDFFYGKEIDIEINVEEAMQNVMIRDINTEKYIVVVSRLVSPYEKYIVVYAYSLEDLEALRTRIITIILLVDVIMLIMLSLGLYVLLQRLFRPLDQLVKATTWISNGEYQRLLPVKGKDEFSNLARNFNEMSCKIEEQVGLLKQENSKKQLLIDNMAHELRTPLTSISGYANYMKIASLKEEERLNALDYILLESHRLEKLSKTLLFMADIREGELEVVKINLNDLINRVSSVFAKELDEKSIEYKVISDIVFITGNEVLVESLLINLVENAIRACEDGGSICVMVEQTDHVVITVMDNGIGMTTNDLERIEEPFYRVDKARSRSHGGIGLGVSLCKQIVKLHQASMYYQSSVGGGTKVIIHWNKE